MHQCRSRGHSPSRQAWNSLLIIKGTCSHYENGLLNHSPLEVRARERAAPCEGIPDFNESTALPASDD
ncbi:putative mitochondrial carrier C16C10.1 [Clarias magur]|uniref:Putative mitochondrial carrier C16C10.1 n=1 Tax=Clarias magur TaxID=1594786 RepID=A0A8J4X8M5_CLAMG|nr:putative mitochondrial carrier C16C10.1 [Clarias magur]